MEWQPIELIRSRDGEQMLACSDFTEDCDEVRDKVNCWLYDPAKGFCPFLRGEERCA